MCEHLKASSGMRKMSEARNNAMVYYQGLKQNLPEKKIFSRDSFSSEELSLSRNSSFSSYSSSATGSSGYGCTLTDSSVSRSSVRLSGISPRLDSPLKQAITKPEESARLTRRSKHKLERSSTQNPALVRNQDESNTKFDKKDASNRLFCFPERSISETELLLSRSHLCSPEGLIITTPRARGTHLTGSEKRARSKSESYDEKNSPNIDDSKEKPKEPGKSKRSVQTKRRETTGVDWCIDDEATMRRCLLQFESSCCEGKKAARLKDAVKRVATLETQVEEICQERDSAVRERNEMMYDRDRIKCERDALELERDNLLRDKDILEKELINRSNVIDHLKEHLGLAVIPVKLTARQMNCPVSVPVSKEMSTTYEHDAPTGSKFKTRPRSKSEIKPPEFYFPDQILKTNAYTCL